MGHDCQFRENVAKLERDGIVEIIALHWHLFLVSLAVLYDKQNNFNIPTTEDLVVVAADFFFYESVTGVCHNISVAAEASHKEHFSFFDLMDGI